MIRTTIIAPKVRASKPAAAVSPAQFTSTPPTAVPVTANTTPMTWKLASARGTCCGGTSSRGIDRDDGRKNASIEPTTRATISSSQIGSPTASVVGTSAAVTRNIAVQLASSTRGAPYRSPVAPPTSSRTARGAAAKSRTSPAIRPPCWLADHPIANVIVRSPSRDTTAPNSQIQ
jgi:hypothetical protein